MPMTPVTTAGVAYRVPPEPSRWPSIALAAAVHAGLLAFLFIGVDWQNTEPVAVEAEVWDMKTQAAAPPPPPEAAAPAAPTLTAIAPPPVPKPAPPPPPPPIDKPVAPKPPDIALAREKRQADQRKLQDEQRQQRQQEHKLEEAQRAKDAKAQKKAEQKAQELADKKLVDKQLADKKLADKKLADKQLVDKQLADKKLVDKQLADKKLADKLAKAKSEAAEQANLDKGRADEMRRITAGAGTSGEAAKSTASRIDTGYLASITSKIKSTTSYAGSTDVPGNPKAVFTVEELPTGEIISVRLVKSSGIAAFDEAVERGINKASPLPKKKDGTVARTVEVAFSMKDLN